MKSSLVLLIPAYNAENSIKDVLTGCLHYVDPSRVVVVDDGSEDETAQVATQRGVRVVRHDLNRGKGAALRTGFQIIRREHDCEVLVTLDADHQHDPRDVSRFLSEYAATGADIIVGRRNRWGTNMPLSRKCSNGVTSFLVSMRTGRAIPDSQCGYRLIRREILEHVEIESNGFEAETEFLIKAAKKGYRIASVPIRTVYGKEASHMTRWTTTKRFVQTLLRDY
ncbi:MAG: glycosyltransferase family 2 protein [Ignavibacteriales bacterium]|nr:glycosyltransferase family 2 protein [Ignavibacteriales bacterium]